jgi:hypothetical protein
MVMGHLAPADPAPRTPIGSKPSPPCAAAGRIGTYRPLRTDRGLRRFGRESVSQMWVPCPYGASSAGGRASRGVGLARRDAGACRRRTRERRLGRQLVRCHRFRRVHGSYTSFLAASLACRAGRAMERQTSEVSPTRCCRAARAVTLSAAVTGRTTPRSDRENPARTSRTLYCRPVAAHGLAPPPARAN